MKQAVTVFFSPENEYECRLCLKGNGRCLRRLLKKEILDVLQKRENVKLIKKMEKGIYVIYFFKITLRNLVYVQTLFMENNIFVSDVTQKHVGPKKKLISH